MAAIPHLLDPSLWTGALQANVGELNGAAFWTAVLQIVFINILLSGDNAVVIALACRGLPPRQRIWGMAIGAGLAVVLLIAFAAVISRLMQLAYLKVAGGLALIYIAAKLLVPERADKDEVEAVTHLWRAVRIVVIADIVMSLDNVIAVTAVAQGRLVLLAFGLMVSIPIIVAGAALIMALLDRYPILVWVGAALLGWVAGEAIATDPAVSRYLTAAVDEGFARHVEFAAAGATVLLVIGLGGLWRQVSLARAGGGGSQQRRA